MTGRSRGAPPELIALKDEAERRGFLYGMDFFVWYIPAQISSEVMIFGVEDGEYVVYYRDMGQSSLVARTPDLDQAQAVFFEELARLAGPRNRGPYAGQPPRVMVEGMSQREAYEALQREGRMPADLSWDDLMNDPGGDQQREL